MSDTWVISHRSAARMHGLVVPHDPGPPVRDYTIPPGSPRPTDRPGWRVHTGRLPTDDLVRRDGVVLTGIARTLVDLARTLPEADAVWAVERALAGGLVTREGLDAGARRLGRAPGVLRARARLRAARPASGSLLQTKARLVIVGAGLPEPVPRLPVVLPEGCRTVVDLAFEDHRVGIELDGGGAPAPVGRPGVSRPEPWVIHRLTWRDVYHGRPRMIERIARALRTHGVA